MNVHKIEILPHAEGKPEIQLNGEYKELEEEGAWRKIHVSLTHLKSAASAIVIIEK